MPYARAMPEFVADRAGSGRAGCGCDDRPDGVSFFTGIALAWGRDASVFEGESTMNFGLMDWLFWGVIVWGVFLNGFSSLLGTGTA
ncbi:MAG: hypothetical protein D6788_07295 [Planctomycetota bacterium]|nr:MAG: hypothetical protein D6788_07295 [Planctomycetota bacterium]